MVYCNIICTGLPLGLFSTLVFFWKRRIILCGSRIYLIMYVVFNCQNFGEHSRFLYLPYINTDSVDSGERFRLGDLIEEIGIHSERDRYCFVPRFI